MIGTFLLFVPACIYDFFHWRAHWALLNLVWFGGYQNECFSLIEQLTFQVNSFSQKCFLHKIDSVHFNAQGANDSKSLFIILKFDLHADIQILKVRNEQKSLGFTVGHGRTIPISWWEQKKFPKQP
jgi:hypothetical protein